MECVNLGGDYQCVCPLGLELVDNGTRCEGLISNMDTPLQAMTFDTTPNIFECPEGLEWTGTACADIDECAFDAPCQHKCLNHAGGYECYCPEGYILDEFGQCLDINECEMEGVCGQGELCFNQLGDYSCIVNACPPEYRLRIESSDIATCLPLCKNCTTPIIHIYLFPLPQGLPKGTPLARLAAHDTKGKILRNTTFHEIRDIQQPVPERQAVEVRVKEGRATLLLNDRLPAGTKQRLNLRSASVSVDGAHKYASNFHIFTAISKYPF
uniref:EGF-like domain-containing protein n=2 Tax=Bursaphelenchus xylophilus TaxID=6326 RepID=A0A1I7RWJ1_BURXY